MILVLVIHVTHVSGVSWVGVAATYLNMSPRPFSIPFLAFILSFSLSLSFFFSFPVLSFLLSVLSPFSWFPFMCLSREWEGWSLAVDTDSLPDLELSSVSSSTWKREGKMRKTMNQRYKNKTATIYMRVLFSYIVYWVSLTPTWAATLFTLEENQNGLWRGCQLCTCVFLCEDDVPISTLRSSFPARCQSLGVIRSLIQSMYCRRA